MLFRIKSTLFAYIALIIIGIVVYIAPFNLDKKIWNWWEVLDTSSAVALAVIAFFVYIEHIRGEDVIKIYFRVDNEDKDTKLSLLRKHFSRSEVNGLLRMIQKDNGSYKIASFQDPKILQDIQDIQKGKDKKFIIKVTKKELEQFVLN